MGKNSDIESPERKRKRNKSKSPESEIKVKSSSKKTNDIQKSEKPDRQDKKAQESPHQYRRYYGEDRPNSDSYWNKYPRKDKNKVGERYYEAGNKDKTDHESKKASKNENENKSEIKPKERKTVDLLTSRTGGAYIPPAKLRLMQENITDKSSAAYQRIAWEALKKSIHGYINKVNTSNIGIIARELLHENIVRGRGLLCKSLIQAQAASPTFTNVYAALLAVINSKFPSIGELLLKRLVLQFKRGFKQNNKSICISAATFVAHLVNQRICHEILALEILTLLVETPTDDSVEVAISFLKECGQKLTEVSSKGINAIFEMLRNILHEGQLEKRIQYMIEVMFQIRKDGFKDHAAIIEDLDVVEEEDQFTHLITLDDVKQVNAEDILNVFKFDDKYEENEGKYKTLSKEILQGDSDSDSESGSGSEEEDDSEEEEEQAPDQQKIIDNTETNLIALRRTIYLTIQSSLDYEECAHKLLKMELKPGQEIELCHMFLDCCAEQRTYEKFYGLLAQRFCQINKIYIEPFQQIFKDTYATTHRLDANRLRNVSKFFAHLLFTDAISWEVLDIIKLNEEDTNSSSRIFIKILFLELAEYMGLGKLNTRLKDPTLQEYFTGLFPRDSPKNTRFSINFFTSIGLGGLTDELREHLKNIPKNLELNIGGPKESSSSSSSSSSESSSDEDSTDESSSDEYNKSKKEKQKSVKSDSKINRTDSFRRRNDRRNNYEDEKDTDDKEKRRRNKYRENDNEKLKHKHEKKDRKANEYNKKEYRETEKTNEYNKKEYKETEKRKEKQSFSKRKSRSRERKNKYVDKYMEEKYANRTPRRERERRRS